MRVHTNAEETTTKKKLPEKRVEIAILFCACLHSHTLTHYVGYVDKVVNANHIRFDWITDSSNCSKKKKGDKLKSIEYNAIITEKKYSQIIAK